MQNVTWEIDIGSAANNISSLYAELIESSWREAINSEVALVERFVVHLSPFASVLAAFQVIADNRGSAIPLRFVPGHFNRGLGNVGLSVITRDTEERKCVSVPEWGL